MADAAALPRSTLLPGTLSDWRGILATHYARLGRKSRQRRFMAHLPDRSIRRIAEQASPDIVLGIKADGRVVGVLEVFRGPDAHAEIGISVEDAYQGRGYGSALFVDGLAAAERLGVTTADLYFACENIGIRQLVKAAGGQIVQHGADCEAHIDISRCTACREAASNISDRPALPATARATALALPRPGAEGTTRGPRVPADGSRRLLRPQTWLNWHPARREARLQDNITDRS